MSVDLFKGFVVPENFDKKYDKRENIKKNSSHVKKLGGN